MPASRILVIQRAYLGDLILTLPLVQRIHTGLPTAQITLAVRRGFEPLVRDQPGVSAVLSMRSRRGWLDRLGHDRGTFRELKRGRFDTVFLAHRSFRSGLYAWATRAPRRVGFVGSGGSWACTERVRYAADRHLAERLLALAKNADDRPLYPGPWYAVSERARDTARKLLEPYGINPGDPLAALAPGSAWDTKRWPPEGYARLARLLHARGWKTLLVGAPWEAELCERIREGAGGLPINLADATPLPVLAAVLAGCRMAIGNDSGTGHLAAAVGTPVITIFGPTTPALGSRPWGPRVLTVETSRQLDCRPCGRHGSRRCPRGHHRCMRDLPADEVFEQIRCWEFSPFQGTTTELHG